MTELTELHLHQASNLEDWVFPQIAEGLESQGVVVLPNALPVTVLDNISQQLAEMNQGDFHRAAIGRGRDQSVNRFVRTDKIHWINPDDNHFLPWLAWTERLRLYLNRHLYLGLFSFESHLAVYKPGDFYKRHLDAFNGQANRIVSMVAYLNPGWEPDQGGELVIYDTPQGELRVTPTIGTVVLFMSEEFPHEVLSAQRTRYSITGWFRLNTSLGEQIDPPI